MDRELEVIHGEMEGTRKSLAEKLGEVESLIHDKVKEAGDSVASIVDDVKEFGSSVSDSVTSAKETLKETFNVRKQIEDHPWGALGAALAVGVAGGLFLGPAKSSSAPARSREPAYTPPPAPASSFNGTSGAPGAVSSLLKNLQGLAIGSLMSVAQDLVSQSAPPAWKDSLTEMVDDLCVQLTGEKPSHFVHKVAEDQPPQPKSSEGDGASESAPGWSGSANPGNRIHNRTSL